MRLARLASGAALALLALAAGPIEAGQALVMYVKAGEDPGGSIVNVVSAGDGGDYLLVTESLQGNFDLVSYSGALQVVSPPPYETVCRNRRRPGTGDLIANRVLCRRSDQLAIFTGDAKDSVRMKVELPSVREPVTRDSANQLQPRDVYGCSTGGPSHPVPLFYVDGGGDDDWLDGGRWRELLVGGEGDDEIVGGGGSDLINGGAGSDTLAGGLNADCINGFGDDDPMLDGGKGDDVVIGEGGDDHVIGGSGQDELFGDDVPARGDPEPVYLQHGDDVLRADERKLRNPYTGDLLGLPPQHDQVDCGPGVDLYEIDQLDSRLASCENTVPVP